MLGGVTDERSEDDDDADDGDEFDVRTLDAPLVEAVDPLLPLVVTCEVPVPVPVLITVCALLLTPDELLAALDDTADEVDDVGDTLHGGCGGDDRELLIRPTCVCWFSRFR